MTDEDFQLIVSRGRETRNVEFKGSAAIGETHFFLKVARSAIGMANTPNGGVIVLGVLDQQGRTTFQGMTEEQSNSWTVDSFGDKLAVLTDPNISFDIDRKFIGTAIFPVIEVIEFDTVPVFCRADRAAGTQQQVLREGALYVRGIRKPETVEIRTADEMRRLISMGVDKELAIYFRRASMATQSPVNTVEQLESKQYDAQLGDFLK